MKIKLKNGVLKIKLKFWILENYLRMRTLKIRFKNWNFGKLSFEN